MPETQLRIYGVFLVQGTECVLMKPWFRSWILTSHAAQFASRRRLDQFKECSQTPGSTSLFPEEGIAVKGTQNRVSDPSHISKSFHEQ